MKLEIYETEQSPNDVVRLRLITENGTVKLVVVDANGSTVPGGYLLGFEKGKRGFYLSSSISAEIGFSLTPNGCLRVATW